MSAKIRINVTLDKDTLEKAKTKLNLFGGKLSSLFNAYLKDFVESIDKDSYENRKEIFIKLREIDSRLKKLEKP